MMRRCPWQQTRSLCRRFYHCETRAANRRKAIKKFGAPKSINLIADGIDDVGKRRVAIRDLGSCRRVFLLDPHLTPAEMEGLAYRLTMLKRNQGLSSVLIATDGTDDADTTPKMVHLYAQEGYYPEDEQAPFEGHYPPEPGKTWHVAGGYDPMALTEKTKGPALQHLADLTLAIRGDKTRKTPSAEEVRQMHMALKKYPGKDQIGKIPFVFIPHGALTDGGGAFLLSSYVMVTEESSYAIRNPSRGLSFDPTGMSYLLPRVGREFNQKSAQYWPGCSCIMGLTGYEANYADMVATGLATHGMFGPEGVGYLEMALAEAPPWEQQAILKEPKRYLDQQSMQAEPQLYQDDYDHNHQFRNVQVAEYVSGASSFNAEDIDVFWNPVHEAHYDLEDPSLDVDNPNMSDYEYHQSDLLNYAQTFHHIFNNASSVPQLMEALREVANSGDTSVESDVKEVAAAFVERMERQSPLALACTFGLLWIGNGNNETLESCIEREKMVQRKLMDRVDFHNWREAQRNMGPEDGQPLQGVEWEFKSVADVPNDLVNEILEYDGRTIR